MAAQNDDDVAVDQWGKPLPLVVMRNKQGGAVDVRDTAGLSVMHYGYGMEFAEKNMTYAKALAILLGESAADVLVEVPPEGGDVVWPQAKAAEPSEEDGAKPDSKRKAAKSGD